MAKYEGLLEQSDGLKGDFIVKATDAKLELKTERYELHQTKNFFIEAFSYNVKEGGPWQALANGCEWYVHYFIKNNATFCFRTAELVVWLNANDGNFKTVGVVNTSHVTTGLLVPRAETQHLWYNLDDVLKGEIK